MGLSHSPKIVTNGLVLCLDAGNTKSYPGSGTAWTDLSGYGRNGTLVNGVTYSSDNKGCMTFDGVNDYAVVDTNVYYNYDKEITVVSWLKFTAFNYILSQAVKNSDTMSNNVWLWHATANGLIWYVNDAGSWKSTSYSSLTIGTWYQIVTTASASNILIYVNANQVATGSGITTNILNASNSQIATNDNRYADDRVPHGGNISSIQIYNRVLSATEIQQNFTALRGRYGI